MHLPNSKAQHNCDDWSSVPDRSERRKIQNRLHQRAWRERKRSALGKNTEKLPPEKWTGYGVLILNKPDRRVQIDESKAPFPFTPSTSDEPQPLGKPHKRNQSPLLPPLIPMKKPWSAEYPCLAVEKAFPLSADHHLITLVQFNVKRAFLSNMAILGTLHSNPAHEKATLSPPLHIPPDLVPTKLQVSSIHDPFIDSVPFPIVRDNMIMYAGSYDMEEVAYDIYGGLFEGFRDTENRGVMIWGEPWSQDGWEVTDSFARKWGFLLQGCRELVEATNQWRDSRGDKRLAVRL